MKAGLVVAALLLVAGQAVAEVPSDDQVRAIRSNCRADFLKNCAGVPRGGREAFRCLRDNQAKLSPACGQAVAAVK